MSNDTAKILLIGYGNPGRRDDGLGPAFAGAVEKLNLPGIMVDVNYQLTVEDAHAVAQHRIVVFADADAGGPEPFSFRAIEPAAHLSFSSHSIDPPAVLALSQELFGTQPEGYLIGIRGYAFDEFNDSLTAKAKVNLALALKFFQSLLRENPFRQAAADFNELSTLSNKEEK
jgi:hydrogenase maturation protease